MAGIRINVTKTHEEPTTSGWDDYEKTSDTTVTLHMENFARKQFHIVANFMQSTKWQFDFTTNGIIYC